MPPVGEPDDCADPSPVLVFAQQPAIVLVLFQLVNPGHALAVSRNIAVSAEK
jgi:hypothetical protein